ncbi:MAG: ribonuclease HII [Parcubacteria group bacterium Gr01-1014_8]|nr:MAG: ribonuclease HII [Parcubacteria group bacterium Gr01-1014_8]
MHKPAEFYLMGYIARYNQSVGIRYVVGIDEAGRGALAGPVCVGAVLYPLDFDWREAFALVTKKGKPKLRDSKQLSAQQRDVLYEYIAAHGRLKHAAAFVSAEIIDAIGIVNAAHEAAAVAMSKLGVEPGRVAVLLDSGLRVPRIWEQESFIRGDETIPAISCASIVAKVTRDRHMEEMSERYRAYGFERHKGYGTQEHLKKIRSDGLSSFHRVTFCTNFSSVPD